MGDWKGAGGGLTLLPATAITAAVAGQTGPTVKLFGRVAYLLVEAALTYGSGGAAVTAWVQTRVRDGTWRDVACFAFTTASATKWAALHLRAGLSRIDGIILASEQEVSSVISASDAALGNDQVLHGLFGDEVRVKYTTTGVYADGTSLVVRATEKA